MGQVKVLVTGGGGFIGSHLARRLAGLGHEVKVFDLPSAIPYWNNGKSINGVTYHVRDITQPALHDFRCDWCFHLAALSDVIPSVENYMRYFRTNVDGTINVIDHCIRLGVKKLIYASSTWVYGIPNTYPTSEVAKIKLTNPYALTKYLGELAVMNMGRMFQLPVVSLRLTATYGLGMKSKNYASVFKVFLAQKANNVAYTLCGDGSQRRDYMYVSDAVEAFILAAQSDIQGEVFNVSTGQSVPVRRIIELLGDENGTITIPPRSNEPYETCFDSSKIGDALGWKPKVSFDEGMAVMKEHVYEWKNEPVWTPEKIDGAVKNWQQYQERKIATGKFD